jgi:ribosome recycling factor
MRVSEVYEQLAKLPVESYGQQCALSEVAELTIHDTMVYVKPYDPTRVDYLEKKIMKCGLGVTLSNDGRGVRVPIPQQG